MKHLNLFALCVLTTAIWTGCATQPSTPTAKLPAVPTAAVSEFDQMTTLLNLHGQQLTAFNQKRAARDQTLAAWNASADGKKLAALRTAIAAAKSAGQADEVTRLQKLLPPLRTDEFALKSKVRADVLSVLTLPQQQQWAGFVLYGRIERTFRRAKLTNQQIVKAQAVCAKHAADFVKAGTLAADPYLMTLKEIQPATTQAITDSVLTAEQKAPAK